MYKKSAPVNWVVDKKRIIGKMEGRDSGKTRHKGLLTPRPQPPPKSYINNKYISVMLLA
jgi:hypothetical protein